MTEKTLEQKWNEGVKRRMNQNQLLHAIFCMTELQARIALAMVMYGADLDYAIPASLMLSSKN